MIAGNIQVEKIVYPAAVLCSPVGTDSLPAIVEFKKQEHEGAKKH